MPVASPKMQEYFNKIEKDVRAIYKFAEKAKSIGVDPSLEVECPPAKDMAGRVEKLVGPPGIAEKIREWKKQELDQDEICFRAMDLILDRKLLPPNEEFDKRKLIDLAIRVALAIKTEGVVSAPLEGIEKIELREDKLGGPPYISIYYAGPIRAAGGTVQALSIMYAEYARKKMGVAAWKATEEEVGRLVEEVKIYSQVKSLQYPSTKEELEFAIRHLNVELNGQPTEDREVSAYRDLKRIETNVVRGGPCLVLNDGLLLKSKKILRVVEAKKIEGWEWLKELKKLAAGKKIKKEKKPEKEDETNISSEEKNSKGDSEDSLDDKDELDEDVLDEVLDEIGIDLDDEDNEKDKQTDYGGDLYKAKKDLDDIKYEDILKDEETPVAKRKKALEEKNPPLDKFVAEVIAGRPVFAGPSAIGGHRIRYGHSRNTGLAASGLHPSQMIILDRFLAIGTQIRIERPGKSASTMPVTSIEPPIVLMKNGDVLQLWDHKEAAEIVQKRSVEKILFLGDMLFGYGEFVENNHTILPSGYVEEWWAAELEEALDKLGVLLTADKNTGFRGINRDIIAEKISLPEFLSVDDLEFYLNNPLDVDNPPNGLQSLYLSDNFGLGVHPRYLDHWGNVNGFELIPLRKAIKRALYGLFGIDRNQNLDFSDIDWSDIFQKLETQGGLTINNDEGTKKALENAFVPHKIVKNGILIDPNRALFFIEMFGFGKKATEFSKRLNISEEAESVEYINALKRFHKLGKEKTALDLFEALTKLRVPDKAPYYMGSRMGRPEKAKPRKMKPPVQILFPLGHDSKIARSFNKAIAQKYITAEVCQRKCPKCGEVTFLTKCPKCNVRTDLMKICPKCGKLFPTSVDTCPNCHISLKYSVNRRIALKNYFNMAASKLNKKIPDVKGVKGMVSEFKIPEPIEKGILRAIHGVWVYRDGTIRADATDIPLTHFTCREIDVPVKVIRKLGYDVDIYGKPIRTPDQVIELKCQDILLTDHLADYFVKVANFVDDELRYIYKQPPFYNAKDRYDLIGHYFVGLAPHTSAGIVGRLIGFTKANSGYAHPFWHAAKRRNCDGDEDGIMLMLDTLLNFSKYHLPSKLGGKMDAPLVISIVLDPREVDAEAHHVDIMPKYPLKFYRDSLSYPHPGDLKYMKLYEDVLDTELQYEGAKFTHPTKSINLGPKQSAYTLYPDMPSKIDSQLWLAKVITSLNGAYIARKVLGSHFVPDVLGNLRSFSTQKFRCPSCGAKYRRIPLAGKCLQCGNPKLLMTVHPGGITKYLDKAMWMIDEFDLGDYLKQRWMLIKDYVQTLTNNPRVKQTSLSAFFK